MPYKAARALKRALLLLKNKPQASSPYFETVIELAQRNPGHVSPAIN
jgi:hypothetical protein